MAITQGALGQPVNFSAAPPTGLIGSEQALRQALQGSLGVGRQGLSTAQSALRGGLGGALEQGERGVLRNASAIGGLGGGNVRRELSRFNQGLAAQDFGNQFQRGQQVLAAQQAPASQAANFAFGTGQGLSQNQLQNTINAQNQIFGTGQQLAGGRAQAGRDIGQNVSQTSSALSNLVNQQGSGLADIIGGGSTNIASLLQGFGGGEGQSNERLAELLSNLAVQQASQSTGQTSGAQFLNNTGQLGNIAQLAGGVGGLLTGLSDERLKKNKQPIGEINGHTLWSWSWNEEAEEVFGLVGDSTGFMAQEVMKKIPNAVEFDPSGYYKVHYGVVLNA
jgi:hypothetical protein